MPNLLTIGLTALGTLGLSAGAVAVVNNIPATKDIVSISVKDTDITGVKAETSLQDKETIKNLNTELAEGQEIINSTQVALDKEKENVANLTNQVNELEQAKANNEAEINRLENNKVELENQINDLTSEVEVKSGEISVLQNQVQANNTRIAELETNAEVNAEEIARLNSVNVDLNSEIEAKSLEIQVKETEIEEIWAEYDVLVAESEELYQLIDELSEVRDNLLIELEDSQQALDNLSDQLESVQSSVLELQSQVDKYTQALENHVIITYNVDGVETYQLQDKGSSIDFEEPEKYNFVFKGWSFSEGGEVIADNTLLTEDQTLYAVFVEYGLYKNGTQVMGWSKLVENQLVTLSGTTITDCNESVSGDLIIPQSIKSIKAGAFNSCSSLTSVKIPNGVTAIETETFYGCKGLISVEIPNTVKSIGSAAFYGCSSLESIEIPDSVTSIKDLAFMHCSNLISVKIPNGVTTIDHATFSCCSNLISIEIPNSVTTIKDWAFANCSSLEYLIIPASVVTVGNQIVTECFNLSSIYIATTQASISSSGNSTCSDGTFYGAPSDCEVYCVYSSEISNEINGQYWLNYSETETLSVYYEVTLEEYLDIINAVDDSNSEYAEVWTLNEELTFTDEIFDEDINIEFEYMGRSYDSLMFMSEPGFHFGYNDGYQHYDLVYALVTWEDTYILGWQEGFISREIAFKSVIEPDSLLGQWLAANATKIK